jgi:hypothetical protein
MTQPVHKRLEPTFKLVSFGHPWSAPPVAGFDALVWPRDGFRESSPVLWLLA